MEEDIHFLLDLRHDRIAVVRRLQVGLVEGQQHGEAALHKEPRGEKLVQHPATEINPNRTFYQGVSSYGEVK
jgi:hypothetical protein